MALVKFEAPKVQDYCDLRVNAGMSPKSIEAAEKGLPNACFNVTIYEQETLIGMGRVIGDGGTAFQIVDIAVDKNHQGLGYGRKIMEEIMTYIDSVAEKGTYVSLMADLSLIHISEPTRPY